MFKRPRVFAPILLVLPLGFCPAQEAPRPAARTGTSLSVFDAISGHLEPSTVTLRQTSFNFPGSHLRSDTVDYSVEVSIAPQLTLFEANFDGPLGGSYMLNAVPKFVVRRLDGIGSNPVRTPSYIPSVTLYYSPTDSLTTEADYWFLSFGISHYSNGDAGPFLQSDGTINNVNGSFSLWSNYAGIHLYNDWPVLPAYKALQVEIFHHKEGLLDALYPDYALSLRVQSRDYFHPAWHGLQGHTRILTDLIWNIRNTSSLPDARKPVPFSGALTAAYFPGKMFPAVSLFGRAYAGFDYYNINFDREIYRVDAGLMVGLH
jgi:hypothetical protein